MPPGFSWVIAPHLAALANPSESEHFGWLRAQGVEFLISLTEESPPRRWINEAGLMSVHIPVPDMTAPLLDQLGNAVATIDRARRSQLGVAVHCTAGLGRTGTVLAAYLVSQGQSAAEAIRSIREIRPGSIETEEQERAVHDFESHLRRTSR